ncbi:WhiB family transcriptional regulator [Streptomyces bacillaris]|uniref:WhiB family transcriptional regulator n=1 Tax=Streptomyces bacillaris TaxID=68179 RepID=UPI00380A2E5C
MKVRHFATTSHTAPDTLDRAANWRLAALCADAVYDPETWFPEPGDRMGARDAVRTCLSCPVVSLCRQAAAEEERGLGQVSRWGIRGGLTPAQRWAADTSTRASHGKGGRQLAPCGTPAAYDRHVKRGETADDACRLAHNKRTQEQKRRARQRGPAVPDGCGTTRAYYRHLQAGEPVDPACQAASDAYEQQLTPPPGPPECGTRGGYQRHRRLGETACAPCRQANADADRRLRNTGTSAAA